MPSYLRLLTFVKKIKKEVFCKILLGLTITATYVGQAVAISRGVASVFAGESFDFLLSMILIAVALILVRGVLVRFMEVYSRTMAAKVKGCIRDELLEKLMALGPQYQDQKRSGKMNSLLTDGVEAMESFLVNYIPQVFIAFFTVTSLVAYILYLDVLIGLIIFVAVVISIIGPHITMPFCRNSTIMYWKSYAVLNSQYIDTMQGMNTLKAFNSGKSKGKELESDAMVFYRDSVRNTGYSLLASAIITLFMAIGSSVSVAFGAWHTATGILPYASLVTILFLVPECVRPITDMNTYWHGSYLGFSVAEELFEILDKPIIVENKENGNRSNMDNDKLPAIDFRNVSFRYPTKNTDALEHISFHIDPGKTVAVVGKSGSGKSTLVNALLRFYDVSDGAIYCNDMDIREYDLAYLRSNISVVFQDTYIFYGTIAQNLRMANADASMEELIDAAKAANAHEFIMSMPQGYDTIVGERGATLSGGERQRIAIARAVLKKSPLLILDEATSSVDAASERVIQEALDRLMKNHTTLVIAHRLSTIQNADSIVVLDQGTMVEKGTHKELLKKNGAYAALIKAQKQEGGR